MGLIEQRDIAAANLAKVATDRIPRCKHERENQIGNLAKCANESCGRVRYRKADSDIFRGQQDKWMNR